MLLQVTKVETLFYYDEPLVILINNSILAYVTVETKDYYYLGFSIDPWNLLKFKRGQIDLRSLVLNNPHKEWFLIEYLLDDGRNYYNFKEIKSLKDYEHEIPKEGFYLNNCR